MSYTITPEADRLALRLIAALADVADEGDCVSLAAVLDDLDADEGPTRGDVALALARRHLVLMRRHYGAEPAPVILAAQIAGTHVEDTGDATK